MLYAKRRAKQVYQIPVDQVLETPVHINYGNLELKAKFDVTVQHLP